MWPYWLDRLARRFPGRPARRAADTFRRPRLEALEQRSLPAVAFGFQGAVGSTGADVGYAVASDAAGNVYVTGSFTGAVDFDFGSGTAWLTSAGSTDVFVAKYSSAGSLLWATSMGGTLADEGRGIAVDGSDNVYTTGAFQDTAAFGTDSLTSAGSNDVFVSKLDSSGNHLWATRMGGTLDDQGLGIAVDGSGNVYTTGFFQDTAAFGTDSLTSAGSNDVFVSKLDSSGTVLWASSMGGTLDDQGLGIAVDTSGNVHTTGVFQDTVAFGTDSLTSAGGYDVFVSKLDSSGNHLWATRMGGTGTDWGEGIAVDGSGNAYTTGYFEGSAAFGTTSLSSAGNTDVFVSKLNASGSTLWATRMGGTGIDFGVGIAVDGSGNAYTTGGFEGTAAFGANSLSSAGGFDVFVSKLNASGGTFWATRMGGSADDYGESIAVAGGGNVYATGAFGSTDAAFGATSLSSAGGFDVFVSKLIDDSQAPTTGASLSGSQGSNGWYYTPVQVTLSASDDRSGVAQTLYRIDGGAWQTYSGPFTVSGNGTHTVDYYSADNAGNAEAAKSLSFTVEDRFVVLDNTLFVNGTGGNDTFTFSVDASNMYVSVNGVSYQVSRSDVQYVGFDGQGGLDTGYYWGTPLSDFLWIGPGWAVLTDLSYYLYAVDMEIQYVAGGGGIDYAAVYGSAGNDFFYTAPGVSYMLNWFSYGNGLFGFTSVVADSQGGFDQAYFYDSTGDDYFVAAPGVAAISDASTYYGAAYGFVFNYGVMTSGGSDQAFFFDSAGADTFYKEGGSYLMAGASYWNGASYPALAHAYSSGEDLWYSFDSFDDPFATSVEM